MNQRYVFATPLAICIVACAACAAAGLVTGDNSFAGMAAIAAYLGMRLGKTSIAALRVQHTTEALLKDNGRLVASLKESSRIIDELMEANKDVVTKNHILIAKLQEQEEQYRRAIRLAEMVRDGRG